MKKWVQKTAGLLLSAFLSLGLGARVRAADDEEPLPAPAPTNVVEPVPTAAEEPRPVETEPAARNESVETMPEAARSASAPSDPAPSEVVPAPAAEEAAVTPADEIPTPVEAGSAGSASEESADIAPMAEAQAPAEEPGPEEHTSADKPEEAMPAAASPFEENDLPETPPEEDAEPEKSDPDPEAPTIQEIPFEAGPVGDKDLGEEAAAEENPDDTAIGTESRPVVRLARSAPSPAAASDTGSGSGRSSLSSPAAVVDGTVVSGSVDVDSGTWRYAAESNQLFFINYQESSGSVVTGETGGTIVSAGLNRIGTLSCSGDVTIVGTGILLVDSLEMAEESSLSLKTNTAVYADGTGSVALFLRQDDDSYLLVNGSLPGILDESYTIEGIKLVVPKDSSLLINSVGAEYFSDTGETRYYFGEETHSSSGGVIEERAGALIICDGAALEILEGGHVEMSALASVHERIDYYLPLLRTEGSGSLALNGTVSGGGTVSLDNGGQLSGEGELSGREISISSQSLDVSSILYRADKLNISGSSSGDPDTSRDTCLNISDTGVSVSGALYIRNLISSGRSSFLFGNSGSIIEDLNVTGTLEMFATSQYGEYSSEFADGGSGPYEPDPDGRPHFYDELCLDAFTGANPSATITGTVTGTGTVDFKSGVYTIASGVSVTAGQTVNNGDDAGDPPSDNGLPSFTNSGYALVFDHSSGKIMDPAVVPLSLQPDSAPTPYPDGSVPMVGAVIRENPPTYALNDIVLEKTVSLPPLAVTVTNGQLSVSRSALITLADALRQSELAEKDSRIKGYLIEFFRHPSADTLSVAFFANADNSFYDLPEGSDKLPDSIDASDLSFIRVTMYHFYLEASSSTSGVSVTSASTSPTGAGILGGSGSVGVTGQNTLLFRGKPSSHTEQDSSEPGYDPASSGAKPDAVSLRSPASDTVPPQNGASENDLHVIVTLREAGNTVRVYRGTKEITDLSGKIVAARVRFDLPGGWDKNALFVVFRNADNTLTVFKAEYDDGTLVFDTDRTGRFALVSFPYPGELFTPDFYDALAERDEIRFLPVRR